MHTPPAATKPRTAHHARRAAPRLILRPSHSPPRSGALSGGGPPPIGAARMYSAIATVPGGPHAKPASSCPVSGAAVPFEQHKQGSRASSFPRNLLMSHYDLICFHSRPMVPDTHSRKGVAVLFEQHRQGSEESVTPMQGSDLQIMS